MIREKFLGVTFLKDEENNIAFKEGDDKKETMPISQMRKSILETVAEEDVELSNYKFQKFLNDKGMFKESKEATGIDINKIKVKNRKIVNEMKFASGSFLEGFLSFYGIQLDKSLEKYENNLHVIEEDEKAFIGKVDRNGEIKKVSPTMEKEKAIERLKEFESQREMKRKKQLNQEHDMQIKLERTKEDK